MKKVVFVTIAAFVFTGCATTSPSSSSVMATGGVMSAAGLPGGGIMVVGALGMKFAGMVSEIGKPEFGGYSPKAIEVVLKTPIPGLDGNGVVKRWLPRGVKSGNTFKQVTAENTPPELLDMAVLLNVASMRYKNGDFGDGGEEALKRNLDAWRDKKQVVAEYRSEKGSRVVIVSNKREPGKLYLYDEWQDMNKAAKPA